MLSLIAILVQEPVPTPASQDWALVERPDRNTVMAVTAFDSGIILTSRCVNGAFEVTINGLPPARSGFSRELRVAVGEEELQTQTWTVGADRSAAFSRLPAFLARRLAKGGQLQIAVPGPRDWPSIRYVMDLPPSPAVLEQTLSACGRPLIDARDIQMSANAPDGLSDGIDWVSMPAIVPPDSVNGRYVTRGSVSVSCLVTAAGRLRDCLVESEHPAGYRLGQAVLGSVQGGRVRSTADLVGSLEGKLVVFTVNFRE